MAQKQGTAGLKAQPVPFLPIPGQIGPGREGKLFRTLAPWKSPQSRATQEQSPGDACQEDGCRWTGSLLQAAPIPPPPELATCPKAVRHQGGERGALSHWPSSPSPLLRAAQTGGSRWGGHDVTSRWQGARWTPTPTHRSPGARSPFLSLQLLARAISSFSAERGFATRRSAGDSETRSPGGGEATQPQARGRWEATSGSRQVRPGPAPPATQAPQQPSVSPRGRHPGRRPPGRTHPGPAPTRPAPPTGAPSATRSHPGPRAHRAGRDQGAAAGPAPTRGAAVGASRVPGSLQQLQDRPAPLLGHGRDAARRDAGRARACAPPR